MFRFGIFVILSLMTSCSFGFTMDRSAAIVPPTWDMAPSLDTYQRVFIDPALNSKMPATGIDKILHVANAKVSTKLTEKMPENQTREKRLTTENIGTEIKLFNDVALLMKNDTSDSSKENTSAVATPRNVILLLIDEKGQNEKNEDNLWKDYKEKLSFAIEGFLQNCGDKIETSGIFLNGALINENKEQKCDCERILRSSIVELLFWARHTRRMTTGAVSGSNFSIPFFPRFKFDESNESDTKSELRKNKHNSHDVWQMIDLSDRAKSLPSLITANPKTERTTNYESAWDIFDVFSKIRVAFFRSLLESLSRNDGTSENEFFPRRSFHPKPTTINLIENTIKELKSIPNDNGNLLIVSVPKNEGAVAVDLLIRETSPKDTLLVIIQICAGDKKYIPYIAQGPNNQVLREIKAVSELPNAIKKAIASDCNGSRCINRQRRDVPRVSRAPIEIFSQELSAQKRVIRDKDTIKKRNESSKLNDTSVEAIVSTENTTNIEKEKQARSSTSLKILPCGLTTAVGVATSVLAVAVLTTS